MHTLHIDLQDFFSLREKCTVVIPQCDWACHNAGWVHGLRNRNIKKSVVVVKHFWIFCSCFFLIQLKQVFNLVIYFANPWILLKNPLIFLFEFCVLFGELFYQLSPWGLLQSFRQNELTVFIKKIQGKYVSHIAKGNRYAIIF